MRNAVTAIIQPRHCFFVSSVCLTRLDLLFIIGCLVNYWRSSRMTRSAFHIIVGDNTNKDESISRLAFHFIAGDNINKDERIPRLVFHSLLVTTPTMAKAVDTVRNVLCRIRRWKACFLPILPIRQKKDKETYRDR